MESLLPTESGDQIKNVRGEEVPALPSFSMVLETENLSVAEIDDLFSCLDSIMNQDLSPKRANEFILIQSGKVPSSRIEAIQSRFPWISIMGVESDSGYYEAKMEGARNVTGEVVVFCDSDCVYGKGWLRHPVESFLNPEVQIVGGETAVRVNGFYSLALALAWTFPPFSNRQGLYVSDGYAANNVAFRRSFLLKHPIPCELGLYRGNCALHALECRKQGYLTWREPRSRAVHPLLKPSHFLWRFMFGAHHRLTTYRLSTKPITSGRWIGGAVILFWIAPKIFLYRASKPIFRIPTLIWRNPKNMFFLPGALIWILAANVATLAGLALSVIYPSFYHWKWGINLRDGNKKLDSKA